MDYLVLRTQSNIRVDAFSAIMKEKELLEQRGEEVEVYNAVLCGSCFSPYADDLDALCCPCHDDY